MIYLSIAEKVKSRINSAEFQLYQPIPSENKLAEEYGVARMTIRRAIDSLVKEGYLERRHGSGCYIIDKEVMHENKGLNSLTEQAIKSNKTLNSKVVTFTIIPCPTSVAQRLKVKPGESIYYTVRVRFFDERPVHYEESFLPVSLYPTLSVYHLEHSKFDYIEKDQGLVIEGNYFTFKPQLVPEGIARHLELQPGELVMQVTSISHAPDGRILDYSITTENIHRHQATYYYRRSNVASSLRGHTP